jgi:hypothetical protein
MSRVTVGRVCHLRDCLVAARRVKDELEMNSGRWHRGTTSCGSRRGRPRRLQRKDQPVDVIITITAQDKWVDTYKHEESRCVLFPGVGHMFVVLSGLFHVRRPHLACWIFLDCRRSYVEL